MIEMLLCLVLSCPAEPKPDMWLHTAVDIHGHTVWDDLAECESNQRWDLDIGTFDGGLQFHPATWDAFSDPIDPAYAWQASRARQIVIAERVLEVQGWGAWPACSQKLGLR